MAYVYRGNKRDTPETVWVRTASTPGRKPVNDPGKCGTHKGYKQHERYGTPPCDPCKEAKRLYQRERRKRTLKPCGTHAAYRRHIVDGSTPCDPCRVANNEYNRAHDHTTAAPFNPDACGTYKGYRRHKRRDMDPCPACRKAAAQYIADRREKLAAA